MAARRNNKLSMAGNPGPTFCLQKTAQAAMSARRGLPNGLSGTAKRPVLPPETGRLGTKFRPKRNALRVTHLPCMPRTAKYPYTNGCAANHPPTVAKGLRHTLLTPDNVLESKKWCIFAEDKLRSAICK